MEDNEIDQFISVLRYNGIRIPKILTQRSCKQNKKNMIVMSLSMIWQ